MPQFEKHFTLGEANELIPWISSVFDKAHRIIEAAESTQNSAEEAHAWPDRHKPHPSDDEAPWTGLSTGDKIELVNGLMNAMQERGIVIQDVRRGLIDFPGIHGEEEVLLCYELADGGEITHWHGLQAGFAGRQPLDDLIN